MLGYSILSILEITKFKTKDFSYHDNLDLRRLLISTSVCA